MPKLDISQFEPIPGFDSLKWKQEVQTKIYEETKDLTPAQRRARLRQAVEQGDVRRAERERRIASGDTTVATFTVR